MKKQYLFVLGLMMAGLSASAQNLVENGDFENWMEANPVNFDEVISPTGTPPPVYNDNLTKETTIIRTGNSARQTSQASTQYLESTELIEVIPGHSYTISYWYRDNDDHAKTRIWSAWLQENGTTFTTLTDDAATLRYDDQNLSYSTDSPNWVHKELTLTAPAAATHFRYQVRTYRETTTADGGFIYYDDLSFTDNSVAGVNDNTISGLKMYPNPLTGNVLTIITDNNTAKTVTVFDMLGKQVVNTTTNNSAIEVADLTSGIYIVKITEEGKTATKKLVVQ